MALFHRATVTPSKAEMIAAWAPSQSWGPPDGTPIEVIGGYRFDDPQGQVGLETLLVTANDVLLQVPLTYRDAPLDVAADGLVGEMQHSALGTRWVYDGLRDPRYVMMLAAVAMTGQGEAIGVLEVDGRWVIAPSPVRIRAGGWSGERVAVDRFEIVAPQAPDVVLRNERFDLTLHRHPAPGALPAIGIGATWPGQQDPVVLAEVSERGAAPAA